MQKHKPHSLGSLSCSWLTNSHHFSLINISQGIWNSFILGILWLLSQFFSQSVMVYWNLRFFSNLTAISTELSGTKLQAQSSAEQLNIYHKQDLGFSKEGEFAELLQSYLCISESFLWNKLGNKKHLESWDWMDVRHTCLSVSLFQTEALLSAEHPNSKLPPNSQLYEEHSKWSAQGYWRSCLRINSVFYWVSLLF